MLDRPDFSKRIPQLDGLRGMAIAMVVAFHYVPRALGASSSVPVKVLERSTSLGWSGVDLFFVLSGFLIGGILLDARNSTNYFRVFYARRACRIFPLYFAFLGLVAFAAHFRFPEPWWVVVTFTQNIWIAAHAKGITGSVIWSLAIEEQFYLILPAVIYFVKPSRLPWLLGGGIILAPLIRLALYLANPGFAAAAGYVLLPCRMNDLLLGVTVAYLVRSPRGWEFLGAHRWRIRLGMFLLTAGCSFLLIHPNAGDPMETLFGYDYFAILYTFLLAASLVDESVSKVLRAKWLMALGGIAYCVYLVHLTVFGFASFLAKGPIVALIALALTILVAAVSWKLFEKPFVRLGHRASYSGNCELPTQEAPAMLSASAD